MVTPICPTCGLPATDTTTRVEHNIITADSICPMEHIWETRWLEAS